jgi:oxygen-dependent protoporphyrinogen oxidase
MTPVRVVVVGGGIAGLAAAHRLVELAGGAGRPLDLTLVEAAGRLGGAIRTERADGFLLEAGPDSFVSEKPWALALAERIGLGPRLQRTDDRYRRTYIVRGGRLHPLPEGFLLLAPTRVWPVVASGVFSWRGKLRMGLDLLLPRRASGGDESLGSFVRRRLGREALERVAQPLVGGIYATAPDRLSLAATMPRFLALEREHRSLILALRRATPPRDAAAASGARWSLFVTLAGGMEELVAALAARLPAGAVRLGAAVTAVAPSPHGWTVRLAGGAALAADGVVLAAPAYQVAVMVRDTDAPLARLLGGIGYASSATVTLAYPRAAVRHPLDGFGFVVPGVERRPTIACTFSSVKYPGRAPEGTVLLRVFLGGALQAELLERDDATLARLAHEDVAALLGIRALPILTRLWRHPRAMPQYEVGHLERIAAIETRLGSLPGLALAGGAYRGVGIADCIHSGELAAERLVAVAAGGSGRRIAWPAITSPEPLTGLPRKGE